jgi:ABC-type nickel/cobalt efflux system permease component RcnA
LRLARRPILRRFAVIVMMAAAVAFTLQGLFVATSEAATGDTSHYQLGFAFSHALGAGAAHSHLITHVHADGTVHRHAVDDDDGALDEHIKQRGWNMAIVVGVLPCPSICMVPAIVGSRLAIEKPSPLLVAD